jgi:hypothetical protein
MPPQWHNRTRQDIRHQDRETGPATGRGISKPTETTHQGHCCTRNSWRTGVREETADAATMQQRDKGPGYFSKYIKVKVKVKVTLRPTTSRSVSPSFKAHEGLTGYPVEGLELFIRKVAYTTNDATPWFAVRTLLTQVADSRLEGGRDCYGTRQFPHSYLP